MAIQMVTSSRGNDIQLHVLGEDGVAVDDSKANDGIKAGEGHDPSPQNTAETETRSVGATGETKEYPTGLKFWLIILTMTALLILGGLDTNIVATAVPRITDEFHTMADVGWYSSGFRLCACAFQFMFGKMYNIFSVKRIFMLANAIFLVGSVLCSMATTSAMFVAGRAVTGVGFAGILGGLYTIISCHFGDDLSSAESGYR